MSIFGWFLAFFGFVGVIFGVFQMLKGKKMNSVPFRSPTQIAQLGEGAADGKGLVSTEGAVGQQNLLVAPMSGRPCLAYELTVERKWEKSERTEKGTQKKKGADNLLRDYKGATFALQDGAGQIWVDASQRPDASFEKVHSSTMDVGLLGIIPGTLQFGGFQMNTPSIVSLDSRTLGFEGIEKIIPPVPNLYALGQVTVTPQGPVLATPKGLGTGKLILSQKGRASLVTSTKRNMVIGYALGGVMFVGGTLLGILGPKPEASASGATCSSLLTDVVSCKSRMYERNGKDFTWTVTAAGEYEVRVKQPNVKNPVDATITIKNTKGVQVAYNDGGSRGADAKVKQRFEPGTYRINVRDFAGDKVAGGYGFELQITKSAVADAPASVGSAAITNAEIEPTVTTLSDDPAPATKAAVKAVATGKAPPAPKPLSPAKAVPATKDAPKAPPNASATPAVAPAKKK